MRPRLASAGFLGLVLATACGSSGTGTTTPAVAASKADPNAILRFQGVIGSSQDPIHPTHTCEPSTLRTIFDGLFDFDPSGNLIPRLATGYELRSGNVLRLKLRQNVQFQDGTAFDATAVKFNLDRAMTDPASTIKSTVADLDSVSVVDASTVDLAMKRAAAGSLLGALAQRAGMMASPQAVRAAGSSATFAKAPVGAGPYMVVGAWTARQNLSVRKWSGYWDKAGQTLGGIDFMEIPFPSLGNALQAGDVDWVAPQSIADGNALKSNASLKVMINASSQFRLLVLNQTLPPFNDLRVRQALSFAIDRESIANALTQGQAHATYQEFPPNSPGYDASLDKTPLYAYNPGKARQLLADAGLASGFTFDAVVGATATSWVQMGELIQAQLKQVGVTMNVKTIDIAQVASQTYLAGPNKTGVASASSNGGIASADPDQEFHDHFMAGGSINAGGQETSGLRDIILQAEATIDPAARANLFKKANRLVVQQVQDGIPISFDPAISAIRNYVGGLPKAEPYCDARFRGVFITQGHQPVA
ncbi:MAG TPA: ABC transporter substrate-binding protein [Candidatus Dormibacteraeota bacterium]|nr:ABC transporter substrate-binding protein [Candidatus Dormibacteraeota bacterium]